MPVDPSNISVDRKQDFIYGLERASNKFSSANGFFISFLMRFYRLTLSAKQMVVNLVLVGTHKNSFSIE